MKIAILETLYKFGQGFCSEFGIMSTAVGIFGIANLKQHLVERLLLLTAVDMFVVIFYASVFSFLFCVVFFERIIKKFVVYFLNVLAN